MNRPLTVPVPLAHARGSVALMSLVPHSAFRVPHSALFMSQVRLTRRAFLRAQASTVRRLALGALALVSVRHARTAAAQDAKGGNPFAYDVGRFEATDPKLVRYQEVARFRSPRAEARRLAFGPDGQLYVAAGNYVTVMRTDGSVVSELALSSPPRCVAVAKDGLIYVGFRERIEVYEASGQRQAAWDSPRGRPWFTGLAIGENDVFAADAGNRVVLRYDWTGKLVGRIGAKDKDRQVPGLVLPSPYLDVELYKDGLLRVNNPGRHRVEVYTVDGDLEFFWGKASAAIDGFCGCCNPINLALLPDGRCVTCEKGLPRVKVYRANGEFDCVVAGPESFPENARVGAGEGTGDGVKAGLDVVVDAQERLYVLDFVAGNVRVLAPKPAAPA